MHAGIYLLYLISITVFQMFWPSTNPGINPYIILVWCCYFICEELKQIKGSYDLSALEKAEPSYWDVLADYFDDPW